jgi:GTPase
VPSPELLVLDKTDLVGPAGLAVLRACYPDAVPVPARTGAGTDELRAAIREALDRGRPRGTTGS